MSDEPRPVATDDDNDYTLTIDEVANRYATAGHPRTVRTLQRYCLNGHLECRKMPTATGDIYLVTPQSVHRHIAQTAELAAQNFTATGRDMSRHVVLENTGQSEKETPRHVATDRDSQHEDDPSNSAKDSGDQQRQESLTSRDVSRQVAPNADDVAPLVAMLTGEKERFVEDIKFLRGQIATKDEQIAALLERDKETNFLVRGLQQMLSPLLGPASNRPPESSHTSY